MEVSQKHTQIAFAPFLGPPPAANTLLPWPPSPPLAPPPTATTGSDQLLWFPSLLLPPPLPPLPPCLQSKPGRVEPTNFFRKVRNQKGSKSVILYEIYARSTEKKKLPGQAWARPVRVRTGEQGPLSSPGRGGPGHRARPDHFQMSQAQPSLSQARPSRPGPEHMRTQAG